MSDNNGVNLTANSLAVIKAWGYRIIAMRECDTYEEVAIYLLNEICNEFGLEKVEGKQKVKGIRAPTEYTIDAKGVKKENEGFVIIECRRRTTSKQNQESLGGLAYRIINTEASGGIIVSPLGLQKGAKIIASSENIHSVLLDENSTIHEFVIKFLNKTMIGAHITETARASAVFEAEVVKSKNKRENNGNL